MYTCRECEKPVNQSTDVCPYCGADLSQPLEAQVTPPSSIAKRVLVWGVMIALMWIFVWFVLPERSTGVASRAESAALAALDTSKRALQTHFEAHGSYPTNLDGLAAESYARIRSAAQGAQTEGYRLEYTPGPAGDGGNIQTFTLLARPGHYGFRNFMLNESGVVRWTKDERPATSQDTALSDSK